MPYALIIIFLLTSTFTFAHNDSYEMSYHNFLKNNSGYRESKISVVAKNLKKGNYSEVLFFDSQTDRRCFFEFNNHYLLSEKSDKHYSITNWAWFNTIGIRAKEKDYIWHYSPSMLRGNNGKGIIEKEFFLNVIEDGYFILVYEWNWRNFDGYWKEDFDYTKIPSEERVVKLLVKVENPDELKAFLD